MICHIHFFSEVASATVRLMGYDFLDVEHIELSKLPIVTQTVEGRPPIDILLATENNMLPVHHCISTFQAEQLEGICGQLLL